ncbi:pyridoxal phosphate-dependent aminotransferase [Thalassospira alkalitolerans]|uniref:pyridoxal phosphate-dependent aminotransferase n=1 Tax=Thalassospira alkalitolerans TaxID=1293890 RepID=UPI0030EB4295|tara:strand:+ start:2122 stop:3327 length:1206 start_codon:yes stop_codon:yes gene_type:complete
MSISQPFTTSSFALNGIRDDVRDIGASLIREVAHLGMGRDNIVPLWFGEPDQPTPEFIRKAAIAALEAGDTFYQPNRGITPLRDALADYGNRLYGTSLAAGNITVTVSGLNALMIAMQSILKAGDRLVTTAPIWPNIVAMPKVLGAHVATVPLRVGNAGDIGWQLDIDELITACTPDTRAILINSPNNPTGWVMPADDQKRLVEFATERGIWLIADEVYARLIYDGSEAAPSFVPYVTDDTRIMVINSFSKSWAMTGWRLGWITAPCGVGDQLEKLMEFNVSCPAGFVQQAGIAAVTQGEDFVAQSRAQYQRARAAIIERLRDMNRIHLPRADGAFYAFFRVEGVDDTLAFAKDLLLSEGIGLAPGEAFGPEGAGHIRACYAVSEGRIHKAMDGLAKFLKR